VRDIALLVFMLGAIPYAFVHPVYGVYLWTWISLMNPHRLTWGFSFDASYAFYTAVATMIGLMATKDPRRMPVAPATVALTLFLVWMTLGFQFSFFPDDSFEMWNKVMKIQIMTLVAAALIFERKQITWLVWVMVLSIGYYGLKGGVFAIRTGGAQKVYGPIGTFVEGNNEIALAIVMVIPLMWYLFETTVNRWVRYGLIALMALCSLAAIASYSRGAFLAIAAMSVAIWWKSKRKGLLGVGLLVLWPAVLAFMPKLWEDRMNTISDYTSDGSAMGRINAWRMAWNLASDRPLFGGGFEIYNKPVFDLYAPIPADIHAAHSIYFQVLGEHGFVGFFLFMLIWWFTWRTAGWIRKNTTPNGDNRWAYHFAAMSQVSLVGFFVGGAFLSLAYFDLPYYIMVALIATKWILERETKPSPTAVRGAVAPTKMAAKPLSGATTRAPERGG
jgi:probable O-glycosylation ligase (exosortase A-associated)